MESARELKIADAKVHTLRTALASLSTLLQSTQSALLDSQALLASQTRSQRVLEEQLQATRVWGGVWESRYREERRMREDLERTVAEVTAAQGNTARLRNSWSQRKEAGRGIGAPGGSEQATLVGSPLPSTSSSSSRSSSPVHSPNQYRQKKPRMSTRDTVLTLTQSLERIRAEADHLLFLRDEEIKRLQEDREFRRKEMEGLYGSLDSLFALPSLSFPTKVPPSDPGRPSIVEKTQARLAKDVKKPNRSKERTRNLEAQVRALEAEVGDISSNHASFDNEQVSSEDREVIASLNAQISSLNNTLNEVQHERDFLLHTHPTADHSHRTTKSSGTEQALTEENIRLARQLEAANAQIVTLQAQIEEVSQRVRVKLLEQKERLRTAVERIRELEAVLASREVA